MTPNERSLHEYVPLYYSYKTPMAAKRQDKNHEWVYLTFAIEKIAQAVPNIVLSDGNASSAGTRFKVAKTIDDFSIIPREVYLPKYAGNPELGRKKSAELLVPDRLSLDFMIYITAIDRGTIDRVSELVDPFKRQHFRYQVKADWFFQGNTQAGEGSFFV